MTKFRILVREGAGFRPLAGMRAAADTVELAGMLEALRAMCPEDEFTFEGIN